MDDLHVRAEGVLLAQRKVFARIRFHQVAAPVHRFRQPWGRHHRVAVAGQRLEERPEPLPAEQVRYQVCHLRCQLVPVGKVQLLDRCVRVAHERHRVLLHVYVAYVLDQRRVVLRYAHQVVVARHVQPELLVAYLCVGKEARRKGMD